MAQASMTSVLLDDEPRRLRAKDRLYVILQTGGWLFFLGLQVFLIFTFPNRETTGEDDIVYNIGVVSLVFLTGWLISHFTRVMTASWGWKQLGWRALIPRIVALSTVQSVVWSVICYGYIYLVVHLPWCGKVPLAVAFIFSTLNGIILLTGWWCVYFFYHLFDRYNRLQIDQLSLATHAKEAELRALKSQVNPHFIFNSLNSLRALIEENPLRAREAVTQLANLLRYSLQSGQLETVPFEDELRVVNDYLALEQIRHEERLRLRLDIAPETLHLPIPPMLLQTLVENAVKYGISTRPEGGEIAIIARRESGSLRLQVTNPGAITATKPDRFGATGDKPAASASTGLGLANAAHRLRLLFGEHASLQLRAGVPGSVVAEAIIPLQPNRA